MGDNIYNQDPISAKRRGPNQGEIQFANNGGDDLDSHPNVYVTSDGGLNATYFTGDGGNLSNVIGPGTSNNLAYFNSENTITSADTLIFNPDNGSLIINANLRVEGTTYTANNVTMQDVILLLADKALDGTDMGIIMQRPSGNVAVGYEGSSNNLVLCYTNSGGNSMFLVPDETKNLPVDIYGNVHIISTGTDTSLTTSNNIVVSGTGIFENPTTAIQTDLSSNVLINLDQLSNVNINTPVEKQVLQYNGTEWINDWADFTTIKAVANVALDKGNVVYVYNGQGDKPVVDKADASEQTTMPAIGVILAKTAEGGECDVVTFGVFTMKLDGFQPHEILYVSNVIPGGLSNVKPLNTTSPDLIQNIGICIKGGNGGKLLITGVGRANDIPNANVLTDESTVEYVYVNTSGNDLKKIRRSKLTTNVHTLEQVTSVGNTTSHTVYFQNDTLSFKADSNIEVGTANLFVDTTRGAVGIGTDFPRRKLHIKSTKTNSVGEVNSTTKIAIENTDISSLTSGSSAISFRNTSNGANTSSFNEVGFIGMNTVTNDHDTFTNEMNLWNMVNGTLTNTLRLDQYGNVYCNNGLLVNQSTNNLKGTVIGNVNGTQNETLTIGTYNGATTSNLDKLISGSDFGSIIQGGENGHLVLGIRNNDTSDSVSIVSNVNNNSNGIYDNLIARFFSDGDVIFPSGSVGIGTENPAVLLHSNIVGSETGELDIARFSSVRPSDGNLRFLDISSNNAGGYIAFDCSGTSSGNFIFRRGGTQAVSINSIGLGVGTDADNTYSGLTIQGTDPSVRIKTTNASGWCWTEFVTNSGTNNFSAGVNQTIPYYGIKAGAGLDNPDFVLDSSGNVGIGLIAPSEKLEVNGNIILDSDNSRIKLKSGVGGTTGGVYWTFNSNDTIYAKAEIVYDNRTSDGLLIDSGYPITMDYSSGHFQVRKNGSPQLHVDETGDVGIGTDNPRQKLHVNDGFIETGDNQSVGGSLMMVGKYNGANYLNTYGGQASSGATFIGYASRPEPGNRYGFTSSAANSSFARGALIIDQQLSYYANANPSTVAINDSVVMEQQFRIGSNGNALFGSVIPGNNSVNSKVVIKTDGGTTPTDSNYGLAIGTEQFGLLIESTASTTDGNAALWVKNEDSAVGTILRCSNNGHVGVGTSSPDETLSISGGVGAADWRFYGSGNDFIIADPKSALTTRKVIFKNSTTPSGITVDIQGTLSKSSGSFKIDHPLDEKKDTHYLVHSFVESPQANNIYRGKIQLDNGRATINIDAISSMSDGTFVLLNRDIHVYTTNESDWDAVKGKVEGNILTIECQNTGSTATVSWLVIGERQDQHMINASWTDENGKVIVEPLKQNPDEVVVSSL